MAELMFAEDVSLDKKELVTRTNALIDSGAQIWEGEENAEEFAKENRKSDLVLIAHSKLLCEFKDATLPSQTAIMFARREGEAPGEEEIVQQSWSCDNAEEILAATKSTFLITEMMSQVLEPQERLRAFHGVLQAAVELSQPIGIRFIHSCQIVASKDYLASCDYSPIERVGSFNVRFYRIENNDGEMLMDTRGLDEIGIPDLQCHFRDLDPDQVARVLGSTGIYLVQSSATIESGHTVAGIDQGSAWLCQHEESILEPKRTLIDLNPGAPYVAGDREE